MQDYMCENEIKQNPEEQMPLLEKEASQLFLDDSFIVKGNPESRKFSPDAKDGQVCFMTHYDALDYCKQRGGHLPSTRELASFLNADAILESKDIEERGLPRGYYDISSQDENGKPDLFYFNNSYARKLTGELAKYSFWNSSLVLGNPDFAHVFYGPLGGGGGPEDEARRRAEHKRTFRHAVLCIPDSK